MAQADNYKAARWAAIVFGVICGFVWYFVDAQKGIIGAVICGCIWLALSIIPWARGRGARED